jgi:hypothetical protein
MIVAIDSQFFSDSDGALTMLGKVNSDSCKTEIHRPLHFRSSVAQFRLDTVQKRWQIESESEMRDNGLRISRGAVFCARGIFVS